MIYAMLSIYSVRFEKSSMNMTEHTSQEHPHICMYIFLLWRESIRNMILSISVVTIVASIG